MKRIRRQQRHYAFPAALLGVGRAVMGIGSVLGTGLGLMQGSAANSNAEEMAKLQAQNNTLIQNQTAQMKSLQSSLSNLGSAAASKSFSTTPAVAGGSTSGLINGAKALWHGAKGVFGKPVATMAIGSAAGALGAYGAKKMIQAHSNEDGTKKKGSSLGSTMAKIGLGAGALVGGTYAARQGWLGAGAANYANKMMNSAPMKFLNDNKMTIGMGAAMAAVPTMFMMRKAQNARAEMENQPQERGYSTPAAATGGGGFGIGSVISGVTNFAKQQWKYGKRLAADPTKWAAIGAKKMSGGLATAGAMRKLGSSLQNSGAQYGSEAISNLGTWVRNNPKMAMGATVAPLAGAAWVAGKGVNKAITGITNAVDPKATQVSNLAAMGGAPQQAQYSYIDRYYSNNQGHYPQDQDNREEQQRGGFQLPTNNQLKVAGAGLIGAGLIAKGYRKAGKDIARYTENLKDENLTSLSREIVNKQYKNTIKNRFSPLDPKIYDRYKERIKQGNETALSEAVRNRKIFRNVGIGAIAAGAAYGGYRAYKHFKKKREDKNNAGKDYQDRPNQ